MKLSSKNKRVFLHDQIEEEAIDVPCLNDLQVESFRKLVEKGIGEELKAISPVIGYGGKYELEFLDGYYLKDPELSYRKCKQNEVTYSAVLRVPIRLINKETGEIKEQEVFLGDIPLMSQHGTFLINGAERVVVSQFVRSPGVYFRDKVVTNKTKKPCFLATVIPNRGSWVEFESDHNGVIYVLINKQKKVAASLLLGAIGYTIDDLKDQIKDFDSFKDTLDKVSYESQEEALVELHKAMYAGEVVDADIAKQYLDNLIFDESKYDLQEIGRYKLNLRLGIDVDHHIKTLVKEDFIGIVNYLLGLMSDEGYTDDIDHLGNRRVRTVGEQIQRQFRIGLTRLERLIKEQMALKSSEKIVPQHLVNIRPLVAVMREFFGTSQMSQFMDQTNPLAEVVHKRRLSALGPGGLTKERAGFEVRDIHPTHYGRICPIETPEGPNAGLIGPLATFARINDYGFVETPYMVVKSGVLTGKVEYLTADKEELVYIAPWDTASKDNKLIGSSVIARYKRQFEFIDPTKVDYIGVSPNQFLGIACGLIPFLEHDDANRALMGANMQRQAVPLLNPDIPYVGTGMERVVARDSSSVMKAEEDGTVTYVSASEIHIKNSKNKQSTYELVKYNRSNQNTCRNQKANVSLGQNVKAGDIIADGPSTKESELALGKNVLIGYMPWEGYNFEDALIVSSKLVKEDTFTSIHIHRYEVDIRTTKLGLEEITREVPNVSEDLLTSLDENGIVQVGAFVKAGDILVGKVTPKGESEPPAEEKLLRAIFGDKARDMRDTSLRVSSGESGKVIGVRVLSRDSNDDLPPGVNMLVRVFVAQIRKISIGDKIAGRHGNKGVISTILPEEDMPYLPNGQPLDIIFNPLGVPSRMNVGQLFETMLGLASHALQENYMVKLFDEMAGENTSINAVENKLKDASKLAGFEWLNPTCKVKLRDGRTGDYFERDVMIGYMYVLKLIHLVKDKIHARSTGPYSLVTQQPLGGKAQYGGQRFGEMEVWALEAYGAANALQEMLTVKSDDLSGRSRAYEAIIKGKSLSRPGTPESFRVLLRELRSIGLDIKVFCKDGSEIETR